MALELRPNCEWCDKDLPPDATDARISAVTSAPSAPTASSGIWRMSTRTAAAKFAPLTDSPAAADVRNIVGVFAVKGRAPVLRDVSLATIITTLRTLTADPRVPQFRRHLTMIWRPKAMIGGGSGPIFGALKPETHQ